MLKLTDKQFQDRVFNQVKNKYQFKLPYHSMLEKLPVIHLECGKGYEVSPNNFLNSKRRCPYCNGYVKYTNLQVKSYFSLFGYELLSKYINYDSKVRIKCPHEHIYQTTFNSFKRGCRCAKCLGMSKYTLNEVKQFVEITGYKVLSTKYENTHSKLKMECPNGHEFMMSFSAFKRGNRCPIEKQEIIAQKLRTPYKNVKKYIENYGYKLLSNEYIESHKKLKLQCPVGHIYKAAFSTFKNGSRCPVCDDTQRFTLDRVKKYFQKYDFEVLSDKYVNNSTKLKIKCPRGHVYYQSYADFQQGRRCIKCSSSRGEKLIRYILKNSLPSNIKFKEQYRVMIDGHRRYYDFIVKTPIKNILIEYDGIQHFKPSSNGLWEKYYSVTDRKNIDNKKTNWAINNGYIIKRYNYEQSPYEIYESIFNLIKKYCIGLIRLNNIDFEEILLLPDGKPKIKEVANYYYNHNIEEVVKKYNISQYLIRKYFKLIYKYSKQDIFFTQRKNEIANYYLNHCLTETFEKYNCNVATVQNYFKQVYNNSKTKYKRVNKC
jgi:hypothetical protein